MRVVIVDDEELARQRVRDFLADRPDFHVIAECRNGTEAVDAIQRLRPDLVLLDIQMPDLDGFGVIEEIGPQNMPPVVFVTAFEHYAVRAFEAQAVDFLLKPFDRDRFDQTLARAANHRRTSNQGELQRSVEQLLASVAGGKRYPAQLKVRSGSTVHFLKVEEIDWFESARNYVEIHCGDAVYRMRSTMAALEQRLDPERFVRIHRSTMVNVDRIRKIEPGVGTESYLVLIDGTRLMISRAYRRGRVKKLLNQ